MKYLAQLTLVYTLVVHLDTVQSLRLPKPLKYFIVQKLFYTSIYLVFDAPSLYALHMHGTGIFTVLAGSLILDS